MIKEQAIRGLKWTSFASVFGNLLQFVQLIIVTGFIDAADYGLMSVTLIIVSFAQLLGDIGISNTLVFKKNIDHATFSSVFWVSLLLCWLIIGFLYLAAPLLAIFFHRSELTSVVRVTSLMFIFLPLQLQYRALLSKGLHFNKIASADIISKISAVLMAIILARKGYAVYALVWATVSGQAVSALLYYYWGSRQIKIGFIFRSKDMNDFFRLGLYQVGNDLFSYFTFNVDTILLGKLVGLDIAGFYAFAKNLAVKPTQIINPIITQVAFPLMSKLNDDPKAVKNIYLKMMSYLGTINFFIYSLIAAMPDTIIMVFFKEKWMPAVPALQTLAIFCMVRSVFNPIRVLMTAKGMVSRLFYMNIVQIFVVPVCVYFSAQLGIAAIAITLTFILILSFYPMWKFLVNPACGASFNELWQSVSRPLLSAVVIFLLTSLFNLLPIAPASVKLSAGVLFWGLCVFIITKLLNKRIYEDAMQLIKHQVNSAEQLFKSF